MNLCVLRDFQLIFILLHCVSCFIINNEQLNDSFIHIYVCIMHFYLDLLLLLAE